MIVKKYKKKDFSFNIFRSVSASTAPVSFAGGMRFEDISYSSIEKKKILSHISFSIDPGEILCLLGPSGSGKTTLLRIAAGIEKETSGRIFLDDREISGPQIFIAPEYRCVGMVFQDYALFPHLTILENVRFGLTALSRDQGRKEALIALSRVGLAQYAALYPYILSGGEQQRVALARALAPRPAIILMDEPFSGLDSRLRDTIRAETLDILKKSRTTAIIVTHDAEEAMQMGDKIALLKEGSFVQVGSSKELYLNPVNLFAASFFSELNIFYGKVENGFVSIPIGVINACSFAEGKWIQIAIRTNAFTIDPVKGDFPARILSRHYLGVFELFYLAIEGVEKPIRIHFYSSIVAEGLRDVWVSFRKTDALLFEENEEIL